MYTGFTIINRPQEMEIHLCPPDPSSCQSPPFLTYARQGSSLAVCMGHLYYRSELLARIPLNLSGECVQAAELALALYHARGLSALECLEGDFALAIWDAERRHFVGIRDPLGGYPLFWAEHSGTIAFSTSIWALLLLMKQDALNMEYFANFLAMPTTNNEGISEACAYAGIHRILPGCIVTLRTEPFNVETRKYWHWLTHSRDPGTDSVAEIAEEYRALFHMAVRERLFGRTLADLSGGMDSTSVALVAQEEIAAGRGEAPLHTFSLVYDRLPTLARERIYLEEIIGHETPFVAHLCPADDLLDFDSFCNPPPHEEPYPALWRLAMDNASVNMAQQIGASTILTGLGADEIHDVLPFYLTDILRQGRFRKAWREACKWARASNSAPWGFLFPFGVSNLAPPWLVKVLARLQFRGSLRLNQQNDRTIPPWVLPDFARHYALLDRMIDQKCRWYYLSHKVSCAMVLDAIESLCGDFLRWFVAAPRGIVYAHPFYDLRLLCFGIGMVERLQPEPGKMKPVLAEAMRYALPEKILKRRQKGHFNEVYYYGLTRNMRSLEALIQQAPLERLPIFDRDKLFAYLQEASFSDANVRQLQRLNSTLSLLLWLSNEQEWRRQATTTPSQVIRISRDA